MAMTSQQLSSEWTYFYKILFARFWIGGFGLGTIFLFFAAVAGDSFAKDSFPIFLFGLFVGSSFIYWGLARLKKVTLDGDTLLVSDFSKQIEIPLRNVDRVTGSIFMSPELVWLHFQLPTEFGNKVIFMAPMRWFPGFSQHPIVRQLQERIAIVR
jgi:hypothetical protein